MPSVEDRSVKVGADVLVVGNLLQTPGYKKTLREITVAIRGRGSAKY